MVLRRHPAPAHALAVPDTGPHVQARTTSPPRSEWAYLAGGIQWYGDLLGLVFFAFLLAGAANLATSDGQAFRTLTPFLLTTVPVLFALGLTRAVALLRRGTGATWREAIGALFIWQSTSLAVARASVLGLFAPEAAFLRTPKTSERAKWWQALKANWAETALALLGAAGIAAALSKATQPSGPLLAGLLLFPTLGMAAAPVNSWAARRASLPPQLRERRHTEYRRERRAFAMGAAAGGLVTALCMVIAAAALTLAPAHPVHLHHPAGPAHSTRPAPSSRPASSSRPAPPRPAPAPSSGTSSRPRQPSGLPSGLPSDVPSDVLSVLPSSLP